MAAAIAISELVTRLASIGNQIYDACKESKKLAELSESLKTQLELIATTLTEIESNRQAGTFDNSQDEPLNTALADIKSEADKLDELSERVGGQRSALTRARSIVTNPKKDFQTHLQRLEALKWSLDLFLSDRSASPLPQESGESDSEYVHVGPVSDNRLQLVGRGGTMFPRTGAAGRDAQALAVRENMPPMMISPKMMQVVNAVRKLSAVFDPLRAFYAALLRSATRMPTAGLVGIGMYYCMLNKDEEALSFLKMATERPDGGENTLGTYARMHMGHIHYHNRNHEQAEAMFKETTDMLSRMLEKDMKQHWWTMWLVSMPYLTRTLHKMGRREEARENFAKLVRDIESRHNSPMRDSDWAKFVKSAWPWDLARVDVLRSMAYCEEDFHNWGEAARYYEVAVAQGAVIKCEDGFSELPFYRACCLIRVNRRAEADKIMDGMDVSIPKRKHRFHAALASLIASLGSDGLDEDAVNVVRDGEMFMDISIVQDRSETIHRLVVHRLWCLERYEEASELSRKSLPLIEEHQGKTHWRYLTALVDLVLCEAKMWEKTQENRREKAEELLDEIAQLYTEHKEFLQTDDHISHILRLLDIMVQLVSDLRKRRKLVDVCRMVIRTQDIVAACDYRGKGTWDKDSRSKLETIAYCKRRAEFKLLPKGSRKARSPAHPKDQAGPSEPAESNEPAGPNASAGPSEPATTFGGDAPSPKTDVEDPSPEAE